MYSPPSYKYQFDRKEENPTNSYEVKRLTIYEFVKQRRKELRLTQKELANKANVSVSVVKRFEANRPYNPHGSTFLKMVRALKTTTNFLMFECVWSEGK